MYTYLISVHLLLKNLHTVAHNLYIYKYVYAHTCSNIYMYTHVHIPDIGAPPAEEFLQGSSPSFCCRLSRTYPPSLPRALLRLPRAEIIERYFSVLHCVAVCCSVLQCVAVCCFILHRCRALCLGFFALRYQKGMSTCCSMLQHM